MDQYGGGRGDKHATSCVRLWWTANVIAAGIPMMFMGCEWHQVGALCPISCPCVCVTWLSPHLLMFPRCAALFLTSTCARTSLHGLAQLQQASWV